MKPNRGQFEEYIKFRDMGMLKAFDVPAICRLSWTGLNSEIYEYIEEHFTELAYEYGTNNKEGK